MAHMFLWDVMVPPLEKLLHESVIIKADVVKVSRREGMLQKGRLEGECRVRVKLRPGKKDSALLLCLYR